MVRISKQQERRSRSPKRRRPPAAQKTNSPVNRSQLRLKKSGLSGPAAQKAYIPLLQGL